MVNTLRSLALLVAGALISVVISLYASLLMEYSLLVLTIFLILIVLFLLYGFGVLSPIRLIDEFRRKYLTPKVGILNDMGWNPENKEIYTGTDVSLEDWKNELEKVAKDNGIKIKVKFINANDRFDPFIAVINPYGGVYPEFDLKNFKTMNKMLSYMNEGGLFVNVADIPGYFACNPSIKPWRKIDTALREAPYAYKVLPNGLIIPIKRFPLFELTPFTRELGVDVYKIEDSPIFNWGVLEFEKEFENISSGNIEVKVHRAAVCKDYLTPIIKPKEVELGPQFRINATPLFFVKYGDNDGKILISLIFENYSQNSKMKEVIAKTIIKLIREKKQKR